MTYLKQSKNQCTGSDTFSPAFNGPLGCGTRSTTAAGDPATVSVYPLCAGPGSSFGTLHPAEVALPRGYDCEAGGADSAPGAMDAQVRLARPGLPGQNLRNLSDATIAEYTGKVKAAAAQGELVVVFLHCKSPALPTTRAIPWG